MAKQIIVDIEPGGAVTAHVEGVHGPGCKGDLDWMDKVGKAIAEKPTEDFHKRPQSRRVENNRERS